MSAELTEGASVSRYARMEISTGRPVKIGKNNKKKFKYAKKVKWGVIMRKTKLYRKTDKNYGKERNDGEKHIHAKQRR